MLPSLGPCNFRRNASSVWGVLHILVLYGVVKLLTQSATTDYSVLPTERVRNARYSTTTTTLYVRAQGCPPVHPLAWVSEMATDTLVLAAIARVSASEGQMWWTTILPASNPCSLLLAAGRKTSQSFSLCVRMNSATSCWPCKSGRLARVSKLYLETNSQPHSSPTPNEPRCNPSR